MTTRRGASVIVKATTVALNGDERTTYYGPFLPHVGSATTTFLDVIEREMKESGRYQSWSTSIESVFIGEDESDCAVQATR
jgi:hypothetical protein